MTRGTPLDSQSSAVARLVHGVTASSDDWWVLPDTRGRVNRVFNAEE